MVLHEAFVVFRAIVNEDTSAYCDEAFVVPKRCNYAVRQFNAMNVRVDFVNVFCRDNVAKHWNVSRSAFLSTTAWFA